MNPADDHHDSDLVLWYDKPAARWLESLPVGNGRLGAMVFGTTNCERLQLNEDSLWDGHAQDATNPDALVHLPEVRRLLFVGQNRAAEEIAAKHLLGDPVGIKSYQTLGDLFLDFGGHNPDDVSDYRRELNLDTAVARTTYRVGETTFSREVFASYPDQMLVLRVAADRPGAVNVRVTLTRGTVFVSQGEKAGDVEEANQQIAVEAEGWGADGGLLRLAGQVEDQPEGAPENLGVRFGAWLAGTATGGTVHARGNALVVEKADVLVLRLAAATSNRTEDVAGACRDRLAASDGKSYDDLHAAHVADHQALLRRVHLDLGRGENSHLPTDARLAAVKNGASDPGLAALYFQYGRYLLIASSRPGSLPANLQGLWSEHINAPWDADYHTNINIQMNYWPAEVTNLAECHAPLFDWMKTLVAPGTRTAKVHYGANGWVVHHVSNPYGHTTPSDGLFGVWPMGAAWLCRHLWEHYRFGGDQTFLAETAYPLMKGAARFLLDFLVEEPETGRLVTCPSHSPENRFVAPDGSNAWFTYAATMDLEIIHDLFTHTIRAAETLETDADLAAELTNALDRLLPLQISAKDGQLQEWHRPYDEPEPGHRHVSHLFGLHPGDQITPRGTPELCAAARKSLEHRLSHGGGHTGWSRAWMVNFFARFEDGEAAHHHLTRLLADSTTPNLFDTHPFSRGPVFQIDGNLGGCSGIVEMLVQSHVPNEISLLPALPASAWPAGEARGLRARGGWTIEHLRWANGRFQEAVLRAAPAVVPPNAAPVTVRVPPGTADLIVTHEEKPLERAEKENVVRFRPRSGEYRVQVAHR